MVRWHHDSMAMSLGRLRGVSDGQESLECCSLWGRKESDTTERLNCSCFKVPSSVTGRQFGVQERWS